MKGKVGSFINGDKPSTKTGYPTTVAAKKARDQNRAKEVSQTANALFKGDPFVHPSKIPDAKLKKNAKTFSL